MAKQGIRPIRIEGQVAYVPLTQGYEAIIDAADVPLVAGFNWNARTGDGKVYASRTMRVGKKCHTILMHRVITGYPAGVIPDHVNGSGIDNRKENLRPANCAQNVWNSCKRANNSTGFKGVVPVRDRFRAQIKANGKDHWLGTFGCPTAAAVAYAKASRELHGEFGRTG